MIRKLEVQLDELEMICLHNYANARHDPQTTTTTTMKQLPSFAINSQTPLGLVDDMLYSVFQFLSDKEVLSRVCKYWANIVKHTITHVKLKNINKFFDSQTFLYHLPNVTQMEITFRGESFEKDRIGRWGNRARFESRFSCSRVKKMIIDTTADGSIERKHIEKMGTLFGNANHLYISSAYDMKEDSLTALAANFPLLKTLHLPNLGKEIHDQWQGFRFQNLEELMVTNCSRLNLQVITQMCLSNPTLRKVNFTGCNLSDMEISELVQKLGKLEELILDGSKISDIGLWKIGKVPLRYLSINNCDVISDTSFKYFLEEHNCTTLVNHLRELHLGKHIRARDLPDILDKLPKLERYSDSGCQLKSDKVILPSLDNIDSFKRWFNATTVEINNHIQPTSGQWEKLFQSFNKMNNLSAKGVSISNSTFNIELNTVYNLNHPLRQFKHLPIKSINFSNSTAEALSNEDVQKVLLCFPYTTTILLDNCPGITEYVLDIIGAMVKIENLHTNNLPGLTEAALNAVVSRMPYLKSWSFRNTNLNDLTISKSFVPLIRRALSQGMNIECDLFQVDYAKQINLCSTCPEGVALIGQLADIQDICFTGNYKLSIEQVIVNPRRFRSAIQFLPIEIHKDRIVFKLQSNDEDIEKLLPALKHFERLEFVSAKFVSDNGLKKIADHAPHLTHLSFANMNRISDEGIAILAGKMHRLDYLAFECCADITHETLECVATRMSYLRKLRIVNCPIKPIGHKFLMNMKQLEMLHYSPALPDHVRAELVQKISAKLTSY